MFFSFKLDNYPKKASTKSYIETYYFNNPIIFFYLIIIGPGTKTKLWLISDPLFIIFLRVIGQQFFPQKSGKFEIRHISKCFSPNTPRKTKSRYHQKNHQKPYLKYSNCSILAIATGFLVKQKILSRNLFINWLINHHFYLESL